MSTPGPYSQAVAKNQRRRVAAPAAKVRTVTQHGVLYIVGKSGDLLAPVSSPHIAQTHGAVLARLGL